MHSRVRAGEQLVWASLLLTPANTNLCPHGARRIPTPAIALTLTPPPLTLGLLSPLTWRIFAPVIAEEHVTKHTYSRRQHCPTTLSSAYRPSPGSPHLLIRLAHDPPTKGHNYDEGEGQQYDNDDKYEVVLLL